MEKLISLLVESGIPPNEVLTPTESSISVEVDADDDGRTDLASHQQEIIYDAEGDIALIVGQGQTHKFQLSSKLLALTSAIWKDLIASVKEAGLSTIYLPNDDPVAMTLLLQIVHLQFTVLPQYITFQELYSIARLSQKYQVYKLFLPFAWRWTEPFIREDLDPEQTEWILISWEFCIEYIFKQWLNHLSLNAKKDEDGCTVYRDQKLTELLPDACRDIYSKSVAELCFCWHT